MSQEDRARYEAAAHGMQSGVAAKMNYDPSETTPKHLRTGLNVAMSDAGALVGLLVDKGLITRDEYETVIADGLEREKAMYEAWLSDRTGGNIKLA